MTLLALQCRRSGHTHFIPVNLTFFGFMRQWTELRLWRCIHIFLVIAMMLSGPPTGWHTGSVDPAPGSWMGPKAISNPWINPLGWLLDIILPWARTKQWPCMLRLNSPKNPLTWLEILSLVKNAVLCEGHGAAIHCIWMCASCFLLKSYLNFTLSLSFSLSAFSVCSRCPRCPVFIPIYVQ